MPLVRVDLVVLGVRDHELNVLLSLREQAPFAGQWGLPGGVLRIDLDTSLEAAAQRVARERLSRELPNLAQVGAVGAADRDPRSPWAMSVIYRSLVQPDLSVQPGKRVEALGWRPVDAVIGAKDIAFDHSAIVERAVQAVREDVKSLRFPPGWVAESFTLPELQGLSEAVLGHSLDKVTFRRRVLADGGPVEALEGEMRAGAAHRPAQLYKLN
jgi:ADP-ribose pyrophosphatase YjhB (NUDIX family)